MPVLAVGHRQQRRLLLFVSLMVVCSSLVGGIRPVQAASTELFFSEYVEGSSNNKALEIFNATGTTIDLAAGSYNVQMYFNGNLTPGLTINLTGSVAANEVYVLASANASAPILAQTDQTSTASWFNGDDAIVLRKGSTVTDVIGQIGVDPGLQWGADFASTADNTLRRKASVSAGDPNGSDPFEPASQWEGFASDTFDGLGAHGLAASESAPVVASTTPAANASDVALDASLSITFSEAVTLGNGAVSLTCAGSGAHAVALSGGPTTWTAEPSVDFANNETCTATVVASQVQDQDSDDPPDTMTENKSWSFTTVGNICAAAFTPIYTIQGSGTSSPLAGSLVDLEGVVTGDFQGNTGLNGFFVQDATGDGNIATSDGIFVFIPATNVASIDVKVGDSVHLRGRVKEFNTFTEIDAVTSLKVCGTDSVAPTVVDLPETVNGELERYEGMLVTFPEVLTVSQNFFLGRYGQVTLSSDGRLFNPTNANQPGSAAVAQAASNARRLLVLDDGRSVQNPVPMPYIGADTTLRAGDTISGLTGVLDYGPITANSTTRDYKLQPTIAATFTRNNPRTIAPEAVGGNVKVASFNVLNYFTTIDQAGAQCYPTYTRSDCRGADSAAEFTRQRDKIIAAMLAIDADVLALIEMENNGSTAINNLIDGLNAKAGAGTYAAIADPPTGVGTDAIKVGLIYQPARLTPVGAARSSTDPIFDRLPVAQTFRLNNGEAFTAIVNHFKSKGSCPPSASDPNAEYGQGCWNIKRVQQAEALLAFIADLQAGAGDDDVLVIGDLNSYGKEDPIQTLVNGGLTNESARFIDQPYSFVFDGQAGYIDHALTTNSLSAAVTGVTEWHINADEPAVIDYNTEFKPQDLYTPTPYRSSDHDPVVLGLELKAPVVATPTVSPEPSIEGRAAIAKADFSDPSGGDGPFTCTINYGDGSGEVAGVVSGTTCTGLAHIYAEAGSYTVAVSVTDNDGGVGTNSTSHSVIYVFSGFFQPVANLPALTSVNAGRTIPVKFSLNGDQGLNVFAAGYPKSEKIACNSSAPVNGVEETGSNDATSLSYDAASDSYTYAWKTSKSWAGTCRQLVVKLDDGTIHRANFQFK